MMLVFVVILAFVGGALLALGLATPSARQRGLAKRLENIGRLGETSPTRPSSDAEERRPLWLRLATRTGQAGPQQGSRNLRTLLDRAGRPAGLGVTEFLGLRLLSGAGFLALAPFASHLLGSSVLLKALVFASFLIIGLTLPDAWLQGKIGARQAQARRSLPDVLDLLVVSVEAGVGFDGAVAQAASRMTGPLPEELQRALQEMRLGKTRAEALRGLAARLDVPEVTGFVAAVTQADRLGAGVSDVLRVQSETARGRRMQRIREEAARLPTKMLFPLVFFVFPALFVVLLGPGLINLLKALGPH